MINQSTQEQIMPDALRKRYGDAVGNEIYFLTRVIKKDTETVRLLLHTVDGLCSEERIGEFINTVWQSYFKKIAGVLTED